MQQRNLASRPAVPLLARFLGKFVLDIMPAALASVIGGFLFTQYQFGRVPQHPALEQVTPASAEMLAMVRDEHAMIIDYLKAQTEAEKSRLEDAEVARVADAKAADAKSVDAKAADAKVTDAKADDDAKAADAKAAEARAAAEAATRRMAAALAAASKPAPARPKAPAVTPVATAAPHAPLVIARVDQAAYQGQSDAPSDRLARDPDSLLAKTLDIKDHVVAATGRVVTAIGDAFSSIGDRFGGVMSGGRQLNL